MILECDGLTRLLSPLLGLCVCKALSPPVLAREARLISGFWNFHCLAVPDSRLQAPQPALSALSRWLEQSCASPCPHLPGPGSPHSSEQSPLSFPETATLGSAQANCQRPQATPGWEGHPAATPACPCPSSSPSSLFTSLSGPTVIRAWSPAPCPFAMHHASRCSYTDGCYTRRVLLRQNQCVRATTSVPLAQKTRPRLASWAAHFRLPASGLSPRSCGDGWVGAWRPTLSLVLPSVLGVPLPQCLLEVPSRTPVPVLP